jgi:hypothetical protein
LKHSGDQFNKQMELLFAPRNIFSIPSGLKNAIDGVVPPRCFKKTDRLITASASGEKAHEEPKLIMHTVENNF